MIRELLQDQNGPSVSEKTIAANGCTHRRIQSESRAEGVRRRVLRTSAFGLALILFLAAGLLACELWYLVQDPEDYAPTTIPPYILQHLRWVLLVLLIGPVVFMGMVWRTMAHERAKAEALAQLRKKRDDMRVSFHQLRHVFTSLPVPYVLTHMDGRLIQGNVEALDAFNLEPENLSKYNLFDMITDGTCRQKLQNAMASQQRSDGNVISIGYPDGKYRWYVVAASCVVVNQRPLMFVTFSDITGQKLAERALKKNEKALRGIIESSPMPTIIFDPDADFIAFMNNAAKAFFHDDGYAQTGMTASMVWETPEQYRALVNEMAVEGVLSDQEMRLKGNDGETLWVLGSLTTVTHQKREMVCCAFTDITARKQKELELMRLATTDPLTGALNRRAFNDQCQKEYARAQRGVYPLSVVSCDLDHFKRINDVYGHATGDDVLRKFTAVVQESLRPGDVFGRIGGEEFAILLPGANTDIAAMIASRIQEKLANLTIVAPCGATVSTTASFGVAGWDHSLSLDAVLSTADEALYMAKHNGRNCIQIANLSEQDVPAIPAE